jgi:hypothetical protein
MNEARMHIRASRRAAVAIFAVGLGGLALSHGRLPHGIPIADGLAILMALSACALLAEGVFRLLARAAAPSVLAAGTLAAFLLALLWSGVPLLGEDVGWRRHELPVLLLAAPCCFAWSRWLLRSAAALVPMAAACLVMAVANIGLRVADAGVAPSRETVDGSARAPDRADVRFSHRPDVYLIGFLGASPAIVLERSLRLKGSELARAFDAIGLRSFHGVFTEATPTRNAYDMLLGMTREYVSGLPDPVRGAQFSGNQRSPVFELFRQNGYRITTLSEDHKFGAARGSGIDRYHVNQAYSICKVRDLFDASRRRFVFFGACNLRRSKLFPKLSEVDGPAAELLLEVIRADGHRGGPRLTVAHLKPPLHAPSEETFWSSPDAVARFATRYQQASLQAASHLQRIVAAIRAQERDFVLFTFGDQGVGVMQKLADRDADPIALVQDRFAVLAGVYPHDACSEYLGDELRTTAALLRGLSTCLAAGQDPWPAGYEHRILVDGEPKDPMQFAY